MQNSGNLSMIMESITGIVALYIGLLIIVNVSEVAQINNNSTMFAVYTGLNTTVGTVYTMLGLALFVLPAAYILRLLNYAF